MFPFSSELSESRLQRALFLECLDATGEEDLVSARLFFSLSISLLSSLFSFRSLSSSVWEVVGFSV